MKKYKYKLDFGLKVHDKVIPKFTSNVHECGLLVIPGRRPDDQILERRQEYEQEIIRQAYIRGQPILAICAGTWRLNELFRMFQGENKGVYTETLVEVKHHSASKMIGPSKDEEGPAKIINNLQIHGIKVTPDSLIEQAMMDKRASQLPKDYLSNVTGNSIHNEGLDPSNISKAFVASAFSAEKEIEGRKTRYGEPMNPDEDVIEGLESRYGVPIIGVQWHPEAYNIGEKNSEPHLTIMRYMAKAGEAYRKKRAVLKQIVMAYEQANTQCN